MAQPVVYRIAQACRKRGLATLRFNFRGVGASGGTFSGTEEHRDVLAAAAFLRDRLGGALPLVLAGYSFGSIMAARAVREAGPVAALVLVTFAVSWEHLPPDTLSRLEGFGGPVLALCAEHDDVAAPGDVERVLTGLGLHFTLDVIEDAGHFLEGRHREAGERVAAYLEKTLDLGPPAAQY
jgi:alpha/beta superfamily hydrolase